MYTRASVSTDRYNGDDSGSGRDETQNTTAVASDWSVRPSDETTADSVQSTGLSRLNPAATPFSFTGGSAAAAAASGGAGGSGIGNDLLGSGSGGSAGGLPHQHHTHHTGMLAGAGLDTGLSPAAVSTGRGLGGGMNSSSNNNNNNNNNNGGGGMGGVDGGPAAFGMLQGMMQSPYGMGGGHRQSSLNSRSVGMMDYGMMHGNGNGGGGGGGGVGRMGGGTNSPNSFLPPPGEDTDQQELMRLQQTNYRVKMLPPPLAYEVHRKIWSKNEYGDEDDDAHGCVEHQEEESLHSLVNEDPMDKEQRLEAYKQIMLRWYSHIHVLEGKSEVAKRLVRVRRTCPSLEEVVASLNNNNYNQQQQQQSGAATNMTGSDGGDEDTSMLSPQQHQQQQQQQQPPPAATRRSLSDPADTEEILSSWSARCWDWWQETVKRKPRRARKQGDVPLGSGAGLPTSASAPLVTGMGDGGMPHSLSARAMDMEMSSPHMPGSGSPYTHHGSPYAGHANGSAMDVAGGMGMPMAPSYTSFTDLSEEGGMDGASRSLGQIPQQQQQQQSRPSSHSSPQLPGQPHARSTPPQQQQQQPQQAPSHNATPPASMFTTNGIRAAAPRSGNPDDFLENDHLTLAFTTELLKSLEE